MALYSNQNEISAIKAKLFGQLAGPKHTDRRTKSQTNRRTEPVHIISDKEIIFSVAFVCPSGI